MSDKFHFCKQNSSELIFIFETLLNLQSTTVFVLCLSDHKKRRQHWVLGSSLQHNILRSFCCVLVLWRLLNSQLSIRDVIVRNM